MQKREFIEIYLRQKGASKSVVRPYPFFWCKLFKLNVKPCLFESPLKIFFCQLIFGSVVWGTIMWALVWQFQEPNINYLYASLSFGFITGLVQSLEILYYSKKLKITSWSEWLMDHDLAD